MMETKNYFSTKDISECALLVCFGKKFLRIEQDGQRCWFLFQDRESCKELVDGFWRKEIMVNAKEFADAIRYAKDLIFSRK